jgi:LysR family transcriptional regulator for bpeEF and oprC
MEIFIAIAGSKTLSQAASSLFLPLSTVSRALKRIESTSRLSLVRRDQTGLQLTGAGRDYQQACTNVLTATRAASDVLQSHRREPSGTLLVGAPIAFVRHVITPILPGFLAHHPKLTVTIDPYCSGWNQEPKGSHDIFIKIRSPQDSRRHLRIFPAIHRALYASPSYLDKFGTPVHPRELMNHYCLGDGVESDDPSWLLRDNLKIERITPDFRVHIADPDILTELAVKSVGIAPLSRWRAYGPAKRGELTRILNTWEPEPIVTYVLSSGKNRAASKEAAFLDLLRKRVATFADPRVQDQDPCDFFSV